MKNKIDLQKLINDSHHKELSEQTGHVYQLWSDGEVTMQKSGRLLWDRTLHCMYLPLELSPNFFNWPEELNGNGYIFTTEPEALVIRELLDQNSKITVTLEEQIGIQISSLARSDKFKQDIKRLFEEDYNGISFPEEYFNKLIDSEFP